MMDLLTGLAGNVFAMIVETVGSTTYVAIANPKTASKTAPVWQVRKITDDGNGRITVAYAGGTTDFCHSAASMASLSYASY
jgi:hypothetical protein